MVKEYINKIQHIVKVLNEAGKIEESNLVDEVFNEGFTSSEILMKTTSCLLRLEKISADVRNLVGIEIKELAKYCRSIGLVVN